MMTKERRELCLKAWRLAEKGVTGKKLGEALKISTQDARDLAALGSRLATLEKGALPEPQLLLVKSILYVVRRNLDDGIARTPLSYEVESRAGKRSGWVAATVRRQSPYLPRWAEITGNGYVDLTEAGLALALAVEAAGRRP